MIAAIDSKYDAYDSTLISTSAADSINGDYANLRNVYTSAAVARVLKLAEHAGVLDHNLVNPNYLTMLPKHNKKGRRFMFTPLPEDFFMKDAINMIAKYVEDNSK